MPRSIIFLTAVIALASFASCKPSDIGDQPEEKERSIVSKYVEEFNKNDKEIYIQAFSNYAAYDFLEKNVPVFECPDKELEKTYYFRWWTFRKHLKKISSGYVITEFLPQVPWSAKYNTINCAASHHIREGRWLKDKTYVTDYAAFWCSSDASPCSYSFPISDSFVELYKVTRDKELLQRCYPNLKYIYSVWEASRRDDNGLFWQYDGSDGMEVSISGGLSEDGSGYRATINSYMYADAKALAQIANLFGEMGDVYNYNKKAEENAALVERLWDEEDRFYKVIPRNGLMQLSPTREEHGYVPWMYDIPDVGKTDAWLQLMDSQGFKAPYGPTTAEQRDPGFRVVYSGHECQWNGPSWPFATSQTLTALAACLHRFGDRAITKKDYFETLKIYSNSHRRQNDQAKTICWIDENINPQTGDWISRTMLQSYGATPNERGKDYNHSTFCDLIISGLVGLQPQFDGSIIIEPLIPEGIWDYFCLTSLYCAGKEISIYYDKNGTKYNKGKGFKVFVNGTELASADTYTTKIVL